MISGPIAKRPPISSVRLVTDRWTRPFWDAAADHRLVAPRCAECGRFRMPPTPFCPGCHSQVLEWPTLSGRGTIYSYTVVTRAIVPGTEDSIPYVPAVISLDGADETRLISNVVDVPIDCVHVGDAVSVVWDDYPGLSIPRFISTAASPSKVTT
jgi:uncharacterized protein